MFLGVCQVKLPAAGCGVFLKMLHISSVSSFSTRGGGLRLWGIKGWQVRWGSFFHTHPLFFTWALEVSLGLYCPAESLLERREERGQKGCLVEGGGRMLTGFELTPIPPQSYNPQAHQ